MNEELERMRYFADYLQEQLALQQDLPEGFKSIVGSSKNFRDTVSRAMKASRSDITILILGETGTGKEPDRPEHPQREQAASRSPHRNQLCRHPGEPPGKRAFRIRGRIVYRRAEGRKGRQIRTGERGHPLPGRDRRYEPRSPGETAARPPGKAD